MSPEESARVCIDALLEQAGWQVHDPAKANRLASLGVVIRHFQLKPGHGEADYLLYVGGKACGVIEAKRQGTTLKGVEIQSARYAKGLPDTLSLPQLSEEKRIVAEVYRHLSIIRELKLSSTRTSSVCGLYSNQFSRLRLVHNHR